MRLFIGGMKGKDWAEGKKKRDFLKNSVDKGRVRQSSSKKEKERQSGPEKSQRQKPIPFFVEQEIHDSPAHIVTSIAGKFQYVVQDIDKPGKCIRKFFEFQGHLPNTGCFVPDTSRGCRPFPGKSVWLPRVNGGLF